MKVKITKMPVRIDGKRYNCGDVIDVTDDIYKTIKSICIIVDESVSEKEDIKPETVESETTVEKVDLDYKKMTKDDIMIELAGKGVEFNPSSSKKELYEILTNLEVSENE